MEILKYKEEIDSIIKEMTPLLDRANASRRLRYSDEWEVLDPLILLTAYTWLKNVREKYWKPCATTYMEFPDKEWDILLSPLGQGVPQVRQFKRELSTLVNHITSNTRPFFFKVAQSNIHIKEMKKNARRENKRARRESSDANREVGETNLRSHGEG